MSNSSSSSFVAIIKKTAYEDAFEKADQLTQKVLVAMLDQQEGDTDVDVFGFQCVCFEVFESYGEGTFDSLWIDPGDEDEEEDEDEDDEDGEDDEDDDEEDGGYGDLFSQFLSEINDEDIFCHTIEH